MKISLQSSWVDECMSWLMYELCSILIHDETIFLSPTVNMDSQGQTNELNREPNNRITTHNLDIICRTSEESILRGEDRS
jgi:hypothetical protein